SPRLAKQAGVHPVRAERWQGLPWTLLILDVPLQDFDRRTARGENAVARRPQYRLAAVRGAELRKLLAQPAAGHGLVVVYHVARPRLRRYLEQHMQVIGLSRALEHRAFPSAREALEDLRRSVEHRPRQD